MCRRYLLLLFFGFAVVQNGQAQDLILGEPACLEVVRSLRLPVNVKESQDSAPGLEWLEVDRTLAALSSSLQGCRCRLKFRQIFEDDTLDFFPITTRVLAEAPEGSLEGLKLWGPAGEQIGILEGRRSIEQEPGSFRGIYTFYFPRYRNQTGSIVSLKNHLLQGQLMVRWNDLRERIAITTWAETSASK